jgi:hypothetical protein
MDWCSGCGSRPPVDATFCPSCGVRLPIDGAQRTIEAALVGGASAGAWVQQPQGQVGSHPSGGHVSRGWYPDPAGLAPLRWWTGEGWSSIMIDHPQGVPDNDGAWTYDVMPAWLPDPWRRAPWRWWDGATFSAELSDGVSVWQEPRVGGS